MEGIDHGQSFDFGRTAEKYAKYRDIYPAALYEKLRALGVGAPGSAWLDLGAGTGVLPRAMAAHGAQITGVDRSPEMIEQARALSQGLGNVRYTACPAEKTGLPSHSFDAVTACMCFWYFDPVLIVPEIQRLLRPGGVFVKIYMGWRKEDPIAARSGALVKRLNKHWTAANPAIEDLTTHYFPNPIMESFVADLPFTRESWHGRILACRGTMGSMDAAILEKFERKHKKIPQTLPEEFSVAHKIFLTAYRINETGGTA